MAFSPSSPVTGAAQTGFTAPTYTLTQMSAPDINAKQWYVSALGGTQTGVTAHSAASPFTLTQFQPKVIQTLGPVNPVTGALARIPRNVYKTLVRKGGTPLANQPDSTIFVKVEIDCPAGVETYDSPELRAAVSLAVGVAWAQAAGLADGVVAGSM